VGVGRLGAHGAVGLRSRATGAARLETFPLLITRAALFVLRSLLFAPFCVFTLYEHATPVARERNPTAHVCPYDTFLGNAGLFA
jgi:hypothetical protein